MNGKYFSNKNTISQARAKLKVNCIRNDIGPNGIYKSQILMHKNGIAADKNKSQLYVLKCIE